MKNVRINQYSSSEIIDESLMKQLAHALGTFKSARSGKIRNWPEFTNELIAQYIITGDVTLNRDLPAMLKMSYAWGNPQGYYRNRDIDAKDIDYMLNIWEQEIRGYIDALFGSSVNDIFVM